jgi:hypothetical protein
MPEEINYDAALAASMLIMELFSTSADAPKYKLLAQVQFVILHSIEEAQRLNAEGKHAAEPSVN